MQDEEEIEKAFKAEISYLTLKFRGRELERKYSFYRVHEKIIPRWFTWLISSLIALLLLRRIEVLILACYVSEATFAVPAVEIVVITALSAGVLIELITIYWKKLALFRGFALLVALFFTVSYSSYKYYPTMVSMTTSYSISIELTHKIGASLPLSPVQ